MGRLPRPKIGLPLALALIALFSATTVTAFGGGPGTLVFPDLTPGGFGINEFKVSTAKEDVLVNITAEGDAGDWVKTDPDFFGLKAQTSRIINVQVEVPPDIPSGIYTARILARSSPDTVRTAGAGLGVGIVLPVTLILNVTGKQIVKYMFSDLTVTASEVGFPAEIRMSIVNEGNIKAKVSLVFEVVDEKNVIVASLNHTSGFLKPFNKQEVMMPVDTEKLRKGKYTVNVYKRTGLELESIGNHNFTLLEAGAIEPEGEMVRLIVSSGVLEVGRPVKITAIFENKGVIPVNARLKVEVFSAGKLIETPESHELRVLKSEETNLVAYFTPTEPELYSIRGTVWYANKKTESLESTVEVISPGQGFGLLKYIIPFMIVIMAVAYVIYRKYGNY